jgi:hypothetical protein
LPPIINHVAPTPVARQMRLRPSPRLRVERFASAGNHAQARKIMRRRIFRAEAHKHTDRCRCETFRHAVAFDDFPCHAGVRIVDRAFAKQRRHTGAERRINNV